MPTPSLMQIPKSRSAEEFEDICTDVLTKEYKNRFTRYGTNGQKQDGIDIYALNTNCIVAQCKNYFSPKSAKNLVKKIKEDVQSATNQTTFKIDKFIAMTSMDKDKNIQSDIIAISSSFNIELWFWEDIQKVICSDTSILYRYYPQFLNSIEIPIMKVNELISSLNTMSKIAQNFNDKLKEYRIAYNQENDIQVYNYCVLMFNSCIKVNELINIWYLQIEKIGLLKKINKVLKSMPEFHDASNDYTGTTMVDTIDEYLNYFCNDNNSKEFIKRCNNIVKELKSNFN
ncbi:MAG: hypothetical protein ACLRWO_13230 [Clostridium butyricum]